MPNPVLTWVEKLKFALRHMRRITLRAEILSGLSIYYIDVQGHSNLL